MTWSVFRRVKAVLDSEDIEGLFSLGCPHDEYDGEASLIADRLAKATDFGKHKIDATALEIIVRDVWNDQFGPFSNEQLKQRGAAFQRVAKKLCAEPHEQTW